MLWISCDGASMGCGIGCMIIVDGGGMLYVVDIGPDRVPSSGDDRSSMEPNSSSSFSRSSSLSMGAG